jgi:hypothetical protein
MMYLLIKISLIMQLVYTHGFSASKSFQDWQTLAYHLIFYGNTGVKTTKNIWDMLSCFY